MKTYFVSKPYWSTYEAYIEAVSEEDALEKFDELGFDELREEYQGELDAYETTVEEVNERL